MKQPGLPDMLADVETIGAPDDMASLAASGFADRRTATRSVFKAFFSLADLVFNINDSGPGQNFFAKISTDLGQLLTNFFASSRFET